MQRIKFFLLLKFRWRPSSRRKKSPGNYPGRSGCETMSVRLLPVWDTFTVREEGPVKRLRH
jgi:hypothetical protein